MTRYGTYVEDGTVAVGSDDGRVAVGALEDVLKTVGGPAWTIEYTDAEKERYPGMDTADEGLVVDVVDVMHAMTHSEQFVETLRAHPAEPSSEEELSPQGVASAHLMKAIHW